MPVRDDTKPVALTVEMSIQSIQSRSHPGASSPLAGRVSQWQGCTALFSLPSPAGAPDLLDVRVFSVWQDVGDFQIFAHIFSALFTNPRLQHTTSYSPCGPP